MKTLVAYYSKSGNTKKVAEEIAKELKSDIDEIKDLKKLGPLGIMIACRNSMKQKKSKIVFSKDPKEYDLIVLGGPVWAWNLLPQLRAYLDENKNKIKKLGFFLTYGGDYGKNFEQLNEIIKPVATMAIVDKDIVAGDYKKELKEFIKKLK